MPERPWDITVLQFRSDYQETESLEGQVRGEGVYIKTRLSLVPVGILYSWAANWTVEHNTNTDVFQTRSFHYLFFLLPLSRCCPVIVISEHCNICGHEESQFLNFLVLLSWPANQLWIQIANIKVKRMKNFEVWSYVWIYLFSDLKVTRIKYLNVSIFI